MQTETYQDKMILLAGSGFGIYGPQATVENWEILSGTNDPDAVKGSIEMVKLGPNHEHYYDAWEDIESNGILFIDGANYWIESNDGDIWAIRSDFTDADREAWGVM